MHHAGGLFTGMGKQMKKIMNMAPQGKQDTGANSLSGRTKIDGIDPSIRGEAVSSFSEFVTRAFSRAEMVSAPSGTSPKSQMTSGLSWTTQNSSDNNFMGTALLGKVEAVQGTSLSLMMMTCSADTLTCTADL